MPYCHLCFVNSYCIYIKCEGKQTCFRDKSSIIRVNTLKGLFMENYDILLNIVDDELVEEGLGQVMSLGVLATLLSMAGIVEGATFKREV